MKRNLAIAMWLSFSTGCYVGTVGALSGADVVVAHDSPVIDVIDVSPNPDVAPDIVDDDAEIIDVSPDAITDVCVAPNVTCGPSCADLTSDPLNCGACGVSCAGGQVCVAGACGTHCTTDTDCASGEVCVSGMCAPGMTDAGIDALDAGTCATGETLCGATCVDLATDPTNCGACGSSCAAGHSCGAGVCM